MTKTKLSRQDRFQQELAQRTPPPRPVNSKKRGYPKPPTYRGLHTSYGIPANYFTQVHNPLESQARVLAKSAQNLGVSLQEISRSIGVANHNSFVRQIMGSFVSGGPVPVHEEPGEYLFSSPGTRYVSRKPEPAKRPEPTTTAHVLPAGTRRYIKVNPKAIGSNKKHGDTHEPTCLVIDPATEERIPCYSVSIKGPSDLVFGVPADEPESIIHALGCGTYKESNAQAFVQTTAEVVYYA